MTHSLLPASLREPFDWCGFGYVSVAKTSHDGERDMYSDSPDLGHMAVFGAKTEGHPSPYNEENGEREVIPERCYSGKNASTLNKRKRKLKNLLYQIL